jgi:TolB protein
MSTVQTTAAPPPAGEPFNPDPGPATPEQVSLFGDHPDSERVPFENRLLTNMSQHTFSTVGRDFDPDLTADGSLMVFASTRNSEHPDVFLKNVDGYAITQLTSAPEDDIQPRFSPDGQKVVFCSNRSGNFDIWSVNLDGTELKQLTHDPSDEVAPCFSPDGTQVAFTAWEKRSHQWGIYVVSVDQPGVRRFLCYGMFPDYSPDGKRIAFQRARQRGTRWFSVWFVELVGDEARYPTELAYSDTAACIAPRWSPDGESIVYCAVRQTGRSADAGGQRHSDIWLVDARKGTRLKVTDGAAGAFTPAWCSNGRIYFVTARSTGVENIWSLKSEPTGYPVTQRDSSGSGFSSGSDEAAVGATGK